MGNYESYLNKILNEAEEKNPYAAEETTPKFEGGYETVDGSNIISQKEFDATTGDASYDNERASQVDKILNKIKDIYMYLCDETLYTYINKPSIPEFQTIDSVMDTDAKTIKIFSYIPENVFTTEDLDIFAGVFKKVLKKKLKSKTDVEHWYEWVNEGKLGSNKINFNVLVTITKINEED